MEMMGSISVMGVVIWGIADLVTVGVGVGVAVAMAVIIDRILN